MSATSTQKTLQAWAAQPTDGIDLYRDEVLLKRRSVLNILELYPACELPFAIYLELIPFLTPRYYSISSAPSHNPGHCSIAVGVVNGAALSGEGNYQGVTSNYLARSNIGETIQAVIKEPIANFRLPEDPSTPVIMIGPGTGIAPFRAFMQQREAEEASGENWLFFGNPNYTQDFLYQTEWQRFVKDGIVNKVSLAFSRDQEEKVYVQHRMLEQGAELYKWLEQGAHLYVCGDANHMAKDVQDALRNGIPIIALSDTNNQSNNIDLVMPCNNKGKKSIGLLFWIVTKEYMKNRGLIKSDKDFTYTIDNFCED